MIWFGKEEEEHTLTRYPCIDYDQVAAGESNCGWDGKIYKLGECPHCGVSHKIDSANAHNVYYMSKYAFRFRRLTRVKCSCGMMLEFIFFPASYTVKIKEVGTKIVFDEELGREVLIEIKEKEETLY